MSRPLPPALLPANEAARLRAGQRYAGAHPEADPLLDQLTTLTARLFGLPMALLSLVEEHRVWFRSNFGLPELHWLPRGEAVCSVAILRDGPVVFEDLRAQPAPLIDLRAIRQLRLRFYASQPLTTPDGLRVGVLCVLARESRAFTAAEQALLGELAVSTTLLLELAYTSPAGALAAARPGLDVHLQQLHQLAEVASTGQTVDAHGHRIEPAAIHQEAARLTRRLQESLSTALAG